VLSQPTLYYGIVSRWGSIDRTRMRHLLVHSEAKVSLLHICYLYLLLGQDDERSGLKLFQSESVDRDLKTAFGCTGKLAGCRIHFEVSSKWIR